MKTAIQFVGRKGWIFILGFLGLYTTLEIVQLLIIDFPFNFFESEVITDAWRLSEGKWMYPPREIGPYGGLYAPFYHIILALLFKILPDSLLVGRTISVGSLFFISYIIWKTGSIRFKWGLALSILLIFQWHKSLLWFDLHAKPDSLAIGLLIGALYFFILHHQHKKESLFWIAILLLSMSISTKQNMAFILPALVLTYAFHKQSWYVLKGVTGTLSVLILLWIGFYFLTGPEIWFYVFEQPKAYGMRFGILGDAVWYILPMGWITIAAMGTALRYHKHSLSFQDYLLLSALLFAYPACVLTMAKGGGMANAYQPFYYLLIWYVVSVFRGNLITEVFTLLGNRNNPDQVKLSLRWFGVVLLLVTFSINIPSEITTLKTRWRTFQNYSTLVQETTKFSGVVYAPMDNYLTLKAGKPLIWSKKWEIETNMMGAQHPATSSTDIALKSDRVITVDFYEWTNDRPLEELLSKNGFFQKKSYLLDQIREYHVWEKRKE